jgi:hypothetical protein
MSISNPARFFVNGSDDREFTYEGGSTLFHWSPYDSGLSNSMESNVVFFADSEDHARDVLRRLFEFWIDCNERYVKSKKAEDRHGFVSRNTAEIETLRYYLEQIDQMKITEAPTDQFFKVGWACNDNLNVYDRVPRQIETQVT